jgi:AraC-like DNA-binding protein
MAASATTRGGESAASARAASARQREAAVEVVVHIMAQQLDRPFSLGELAGLVYLSPCYFNRVFRAVTGVPPRRFQMALRMQAAKELLLTTDCPVTQICFEVGYQSLGTFTSHFHKLVGVTPRQLRRLGEAGHSPVPLPMKRNSGGRADGSVTAVVRAPDDRPRVVLVGLFANRSAQGSLAGCAVGWGSGAYRINGVPRGLHHVAAAAVPASADPRAYLLLDQRSLLVAASDRPVAGGPQTSAARALELRPKRPIDPPILVAPRALLTLDLVPGRERALRRPTPSRMRTSC